jgi:hypothetical protein
VSLLVLISVKFRVNPWQILLLLSFLHSVANASAYSSFRGKLTLLLGLPFVAFSAK